MNCCWAPCQLPGCCLVVCCCECIVRATRSYHNAGKAAVSEGGAHTHRLCSGRCPQWELRHWVDKQGNNFNSVSCRFNLKCVYNFLTIVKYICVWLKDRKLLEFLLLFYIILFLYKSYACCLIYVVVSFQAWARWMLHCCSLISLLSVSANTSGTFHKYPDLKYITLACDVYVTVLFTAEMIAKMYMYGIIRVSEQHLVGVKSKYYI